MANLQKVCFCQSAVTTESNIWHKQHVRALLCKVMVQVSITKHYPTRIAPTFKEPFIILDPLNTLLWLTLNYLFIMTYCTDAYMFTFPVLERLLGLNCCFPLGCSLWWQTVTSWFFLGTGAQPLLLWFDLVLLGHLGWQPLLHYII